MSILTYQYIHILGLLCVFIGFGALLSENFKTAMKWHGIGLLISFVSGFALISKGGYSFASKWLLVKIGLWLVLGFLPVLAKRRVLTPYAVVALAAVCGAILAYMGKMKPGF